jgi:hypothetical protein
MIKNGQSLLTEHELADRLSIAVTALRRQRRIGGENAIPHIKIGRAVRYSWPDVEQYLKSHTRLRTKEEG